MESEFEPVVRTEETPEARIVIVEVPGFRKEDLKVEIGNQGNLIISGKRGVKEMEEMTKVGGRLEKMHRFRKVISLPENLNTDGRITAKFRDETLRISLPLLHIPDQQNQEAVPGNEKPGQSVQSKVESSSPARQQDSVQEQSGVAQDDQRARHPDAIKQDDDKAKASAAVEESKRLVAERKTELPKPAQDFVHEEPPISKDAQAVSAEAGIGDQSQFIQSKSKQDEEKQEEEQADGEEENEAAAEDKDEGDECSLPLQNNEILEKQIKCPCSTTLSRFFTGCCNVL